MAGECHISKTMLNMGRWVTTQRPKDGYRLVACAGCARFRHAFSTFPAHVCGARLDAEPARC